MTSYELSNDTDIDLTNLK